MDEVKDTCNVDHVPLTEYPALELASLKNPAPKNAEVQHPALEYGSKLKNVEVKRTEAADVEGADAPDEPVEALRADLIKAASKNAVGKMAKILSMVFSCIQAFVCSLHSCEGCSRRSRLLRFHNTLAGTTFDTFPGFER